MYKLFMLFYMIIRNEDNLNWQCSGFKILEWCQIFFTTDLVFFPFLFFSCVRNFISTHYLAAEHIIYILIYCLNYISVEFIMYLDKQDMWYIWWVFSWNCLFKRSVLWEWAWYAHISIQNATVAVSQFRRSMELAETPKISGITENTPKSAENTKFIFEKHLQG